MKGSDIRESAKIIQDVLDNGAYLHIALKNASKVAHMLVYGVFEKYFELNYIVDTVPEERVKNNIRPLLLVSCYAVKYKLAPYNTLLGIILDGIQESGKGALKGFFTAVLSKVEREEYLLPAKGKKGYEEIFYNMPSWLIGMYKKDYPETYDEIIKNSEGHRNHIVSYSDREVENAVTTYEKTPYGYYVVNNEKIGELFKQGKITFMSLGSAYICEAFGDVQGKQVLDCCGAPGGKSVYLAKKGAYVTSCDIHPHRVMMIKDYAERMGVELRKQILDATKYNENFFEQFDCVLCDVPCSGLGVIDKKRDILLKKRYDDIMALCSLQYEILKNNAKYVKKGGILVYSTCTVFSKENIEVVKRFLESNQEFEMDKLPFCEEGYKQFLPDGKGAEGFFVCRMKRK